MKMQCEGTWCELEIKKKTNHNQRYLKDCRHKRLENIIKGIIILQNYYRLFSQAKWKVQMPKKMNFHTMPRTLSLLPLGKLIILAFYEHLTYFAPRKPKPFTKSKKTKCEGRNGTQWGTVWYKSKQVWDKAEASSLQWRLSVGFYYPQVVNIRWHRGAKEKVITLTFGIKSLHIFIFSLASSWLF